MAATDNLTSLHKHEEELRARSLAAIAADTSLSDHWNLVSEAMNAIYAFTHDHAHGSENELTLQYLGIRLFNAAGASVKLALSGYYQKVVRAAADRALRAAPAEPPAASRPLGGRPLAPAANPQPSLGPSSCGAPQARSGQADLGSHELHLVRVEQ
jgi:hypothetical protein